MSLRKNLKTDTSAATEGVWFELAKYPNEDGTVPAFRVSRQSVTTNPRFAEAMQDIGGRELGADAKLSPEEAMKLDVDVFVNGILTDWRDFEPDEEGVKVAYSKEAALRVFSDPGWSDLKSMLVNKSGNASNYSMLQRDLAAKNWSASSSSTSTPEDDT